MTPASPTPVGTEPSLSFHCPGCGRVLVAGLEAAGSEGPCPSCGTTVRAPGAAGPQPEAPAAGHRHVAGPQPGPEAVAPVRRHRSRGMLADATVDQRHIDRRENVTLLRILFFTALVVAACAVMVWLLRSRFGS